MVQAIHAVTLVQGIVISITLASSALLVAGVVLAFRKYRSSKFKPFDLLI